MYETDLVTKAWNYGSILAQSGANNTYYVFQLTYLLFLKIDDECCWELEQASQITTQYSWDFLYNLAGTELEKQYKETFEVLSKQSGIIGVTDTYFTLRPLIKTMVEVMRPIPEMTVMIQHVVQEVFCWLFLDIWKDTQIISKSSKHRKNIKFLIKTLYL